MKSTGISIFVAALLFISVPLSFAAAAGDDSSSGSDPFEDYIGISTAEDLAKIGVDEDYPLDGKYYLMNNIDFGSDDYSPDGFDMEISVSMSGNRLVVDLYVDGVKPDIELDKAFAWLVRTDTSVATYFSEPIVNGSATIYENFDAMNAVPNGTYMLTVGGDEPFIFAYSCEIIVSGGSVKIVSTDADRATFNSNGNFIPIGSKDTPFTGIFDGNGYVINGMHTAVHSSETITYSGLFGYALGAEIMDLGVVNGSSVSISTREHPDDYAYAGGIAGYSSALITGCYNTGLVSAASYSNAHAGGISGMASVQISGCYNSGPVSAFAGVADAYAGGIIAWAQGGAHHDNYNIGSISASSFSSAYAGGMIAWAQSSSVEKSYNTGTISVWAPADACAGGIVGITKMAQSTVSDCYNIGDITAGAMMGMVGSSAGGIAGMTDSTITNCYSIGNVSASSGFPPFTSARAGGIAGTTISLITNCYYAADNLNYDGVTTDKLVGFGAAVIDGGTMGRANNQDSGAKDQADMKPFILDVMDGTSIYFTEKTTFGGTDIPGWDFEDTWTVMTYVNDGFPVLMAFAGEVYIVDEPKDILAPEGGTATFSALVETMPPGIPIGYQWQVYDDAIGWTDLHGENGKGLSIKNVTMDHDGLLYRLVASTQSHEAISEVATLTVGYTLSLTDDPENGQIFWSVGGGPETELTSTTPAVFLPNTVVTLRAQEESGYEFSYWTGDATGLITTTIMIDRHKSIGAVFCDDHFTLSGGAMINGQVFWSVNGGLETELTLTTPRNFPVDTTITLRAQATAGWVFSYWTGDAVGLATTTVTMDDDKTVGAVFYEDLEGRYFTLSLEDEAENGRIFWSVAGGIETELTLTTSRNFPVDTVVTLRAEGESGYEFSYWTRDATGLSTTTVTMDYHRSVGAVFYHDTEGEYFTLSLGDDVENGSIFWSIDGGIETELTLTTSRNFPVDTVVTLRAQAVAGWVFSYWTGDAVGSIITTVTMDDHRTIGAVFYEDAEGMHFTLSLADKPVALMSLLSEAEHGKVFWSVDGGLETELTSTTSKIFPVNTLITLRAQGEPGYEFSYWMGDATGLSITTVTMDDHRSVGAVFYHDIEGEYFTLSLGDDVENGSIFWSIDGGIETELTLMTSRNFPVDTVIALRAQAAAGWAFSYWTGDATGLSTTTVTMDDDRTVGAVFYEDLEGRYFTLSLEDEAENGHIFWSVDKGLETELTLTTPRNFPVDTVVDLRAQGEPGYEFSYWTGDATGLITTTVMMDDDRTVGAVFYHDADGEYFTLSLSDEVENGQVFWSISGGIETGLTSTTPRNFPVDTVVGLRAQATAGWEFSYWTGDAVGLETTTVTMDDHRSVGAVFYHDVEGEYFVLSLEDEAENGHIFWSVAGGIETELTLTTSRNFPVDTVVTLRAEGEPGYELSYWTGDATGLSTTTVTMSDHRSVGAVFYENLEDMYFTLSLLDEAENGQVFWSVGGGLETELTLTTHRNFPVDTVITLRAQATAGWEFSYWTGDATGLSTTTVTMNDHRSAGAVFYHDVDGDYFTLSLSNEAENGQVFWSINDGIETELTLTTPRNFPVDTVITLRAEAAAGWTFSYWTGDAVGLEITTVTMDDHKTVGAVFYEDEESMYFTLSGEDAINGLIFWSVDGGLETKLTPTTPRSFPVDTVVTLRAEGEPGYEFSYWTGDATGLIITTITMDDDRTAGAVFYEDEEGMYFTLSLADESLTDVSLLKEAEHGQVFWSIDGGLETELTLMTSRNFPVDTLITLRTQTESEHLFLYWIEDATGPIVTTVTMDDHRTVGALFGEEIADEEFDPASDHNCCWLWILLMIVLILLIILFFILRRRKNKEEEPEEGVTEETPEGSEEASEEAPEGYLGDESEGEPEEVSEEDLGQKTEAEFEDELGKV